MRAWVDKRELLETFAIIRQAEMSIDRAIAADWSGLLAFYQGKRLEALGQISEELGRLGATYWNVEDEAPVSWKQKLRGVVRLLTKKTYLDARELSYVIFWVDRASRLLASGVRPGDQDLVSTRMNLYSCQLILGPCLFGQPKMNKARSVEHFRHAPGRDVYSLAEISAG